MLGIDAPTFSDTSQAIEDLINGWAAAISTQPWEVQRHHARQAQLVVPLAFHQRFLDVSELLLVLCCFVCSY